jgi:hypothetical protein
LRALSCHGQVTAFPAPLAELDAQVAALYDRPAVGLLQGLPVSVKECVDWKGLDTTVGCARRLHSPKAEDAVLVQVWETYAHILFLCCFFGGVFFGLLREPAIATAMLWCMCGTLVGDSVREQRLLTAIESERVGTCLPLKSCPPSLG